MEILDFVTHYLLVKILCLRSYGELSISLSKSLIYFMS